MADDQQFCLRWNDFQANMVASFKHLRDEKSFCDVTIATEVSVKLMFPLLIKLLLPRASTPRPTRWSSVPAPHTSRTCWSRTLPSTRSSSWRSAGNEFYRIGRNWKCSMIILLILQDVPFSHLTAILEFMYAGEVLFVSFNFPLNVLEYALLMFNFARWMWPKSSCLPSWRLQRSWRSRGWRKAPKALTTSLLSQPRYILLEKCQSWSF